MLHRHRAEFGTGTDGRLFVGERNRAELPKGTINRVWREARRTAFTEEVAASPLARTPYDLRHAAVSTVAQCRRARGRRRRMGGPLRRGTPQDLRQMPRRRRRTTTTANPGRPRAQNFGTYSELMAVDSRESPAIIVHMIEALDCVRAGQGLPSADQGWCPRQDSNLRHRLRRAVLYPLSYGGSATSNCSRTAASTTPRGKRSGPDQLRRARPRTAVDISSTTAARRASSTRPAEP